MLNIATNQTSLAKHNYYLKYLMYTPITGVVLIIFTKQQHFEENVS